jgi:hypothetical protein
MNAGSERLTRIHWYDARWGYYIEDYCAAACPSGARINTGKTPIPLPLSFLSFSLLIHIKNSKTTLQGESFVVFTITLMKGVLCP